MTDSYKTLGRGVMGASVVTALFSATNQAIVKNLRVVNTGPVDGKFQLFRNGQTNAHACSGVIAVPANNGSAEWDGTDAFAQGDVLNGSADVATLTFLLTGDDIS